jgi:hypothetical protein
MDGLMLFVCAEPNLGVETLKFPVVKDSFPPEGCVQIG